MEEIVTNFASFFSGTKTGITSTSESSGVACNRKGIRQKTLQWKLRQKMIPIKNESHLKFTFSFTLVSSWYVSAPSSWRYDMSKMHLASVLIMIDYPRPIPNYLNNESGKILMTNYIRISKPFQKQRKHTSLNILNILRKEKF